MCWGLNWEAVSFYPALNGGILLVCHTESCHARNVESEILVSAITCPSDAEVGTLLGQLMFLGSKGPRSSGSLKLKAGTFVVPESPSLVTLNHVSLELSSLGEPDYL